MTDSLFPSGRWTGFYNYRPGDRHRMELELNFAGGVVNGDGVDDIGSFLVKGKYVANTGECHWTKSYVGAHEVFYRGFRETKGIWGTWEITVFDHGGFHIWPRQEDALASTLEQQGETEPLRYLGQEYPSNAPVEES